MRRRSVLALGGGLVVAAAGCVDTPVDDPADTNTDPTDTPDMPDLPREDDPPYPIDEPDVDDWNADYLGEHMPREPTVAFEDLPDTRLADPTLAFDQSTREAYVVHVIGDAETRDSVLEDLGVDDDTRDTLEAVDLDERVVVVVESGFGSSSISQRWGRVEPFEGGIHLHGYYRVPEVVTHDIRAWHSILAVDRPNGAVDVAWASLTREADRRVNFTSLEGVVTVDDA